MFKMLSKLSHYNSMKLKNYFVLLKLDNIWQFDLLYWTDHDELVSSFFYRWIMDVSQSTEEFIFKKNWSLHNGHEFPDKSL